MQQKRTFWEMTGYQWLVLFAAWLGWGFDIFDGLLFNYVASNCVPTLLHVPIGTPRATQLTLQWVGITASILLLGWALGGTLFGKVADKVGRTKTLLLTMLLYSIGTAACAFAPNLPFLIFCRFIASLGIGGEWAAGAAMVAEVVPEKRRVEAGALLYTSAPVGLFLATFVNLQISGKWLKDSPETSWRYVFLCGLIPAAVAFILRLFVKEPERWKAAKGLPPRIAELFTPQLRKSTLSGFLMALTALLTWWSVSNFIPTIAGGLAKGRAVLTHLDKSGTAALVEGWKAWATNAFNLGGLIGTLLTVPASKFLGRRAMFGIYFFLSAIALFAAFRLDLTDEARLMMYFPIGLTVFGVFGSFTYYLPELFPTRLRGTGAGFCYNVGRVITAAGPLLIVSAATSISPVLSAMNALFYVGFVPLIGLCLLPLVVETKGRVLED